MTVGKMIYSTVLLACAVISGYLTARASRQDEGTMEAGENKGQAFDKKKGFSWFGRESRIGSDLTQGEIIIPQGAMEKATDHPEAVVVVFLDKMKEIIPYEKKDITYELSEDGWYGFFALDANKKMTEISRTALAQRV